MTVKPWVLASMKPDDGRRNRAAYLSAAIAVAVFLGGCVRSEMNDLEQFVSEMMARKSTRIEPLPEIKVPEIYVYQSSEKVDPFEPFIKEEPVPVTGPKTGPGLGPPENHIREELEYFPLDALRMVGTLEKDGQMWALITAPDGAVHRVQPGNYAGKNYGKITLVGEEGLELLEIIPDGMGAWQERPARLDLSE